MDKHIQEIFGSMVFGDAVMRREASEGYIQVSEKDHRRRKRARHIGRERRGERDEGLGARKRRDPLHALVPADDRYHRRKARQLHHTRPAADSVIMEFSGKELIKGEPDASVLPVRRAAGLPSRREATRRGTRRPMRSSKDDTLCIPTAFCSYGGEALDKKTPLLQIDGSGQHARRCRVLKLFGDTTRKR